MSSSSSSSSPSPALSTLTRLQRGLALVRPHPVFTAKMLDVNILRIVVNEWLYVGEEPTREHHNGRGRYCKPGGHGRFDYPFAVSFALVDAHFAWSLLHLIEIRRAIAPTRVSAWNRRVAALSDHDEYVRAGEGDGNGDTPLHFIPRIPIMVSNSNDEIVRVHPRLLSHVANTKLFMHLPAIGGVQDASDWRHTYYVDVVPNDDANDANNANDALPVGDIGRGARARADELVRIHEEPGGNIDDDDDEMDQQDASPTWLVVSGKLGTAAGRTFVARLRHMKLLRTLHIQSEKRTQAHSLSASTGLVFATALRRLPCLQVLSVGSYRLGNASLRAVATALRHVPTLQMLELCGYRLTNAIMQSLAASMQRLSVLSVLRLNFEFINDEACRELASALRRVPLLTTLRVRGRNRAGGAVALATSLRHVPLLTSLDLPRSEIGARGGCALAAALHHLPQLTALKLYEAHIGAEACQSLAEALQYVPRLSTLDLDSNDIGPDGCAAVASSLRHLPYLTCLHVSNNDIGDEGCRALAASLHHLSQLSVLNLEYDSIGDVGCCTLAASLQHVPHLMRLGLVGNPFKRVGGLALVASLPSVPRLNELSALYACFDEASAPILGAAIQLHFSRLVGFDEFASPSGPSPGSWVLSRTGRHMLPLLLVSPEQKVLDLVHTHYLRTRLSCARCFAARCSSTDDAATER